MKYQSFSKTFNVDEDGFEGSIEAYLVPTSQNNLLHFLQSRTPNYENLYHNISSKFDNVLIIKNLNIDEEFRGKGFGSFILSSVIDDSYASSIILECDLSEIQINNFNLVDFYKSFDFEIIDNTYYNPIMFYPSLE